MEFIPTKRVVEKTEFFRVCFTELFCLLTVMRMKIRMPKLNTIFQFLSVLVLLGVSVFFGYMSKPTEMGLAILAGALGLAFSNLDKFSEFSGAGFSAKMKDQLQAVIDKETEELPAENSEASALNISSQEQLMLDNLANPKYTWRTLPGLSKAVGCDESEAWKILVNLTSNGLVRCGNKNKTGEMIWSLTTLGRQRIA